METVCAWAKVFPLSEAFGVCGHYIATPPRPASKSPNNELTTREAPVRRNTEPDLNPILRCVLSCRRLSRYHFSVIIDFHTHIFPPEVRTRRKSYLERDAAFGEMYTSAKAKVATAEDLAASMEESGVQISVALGFAWREHELIVRHNDYLLETMIRGEGRIIPFCTVNMADDRAGEEIERVAVAGARGLGELRPETQGWDLNGPSGERLAELALKHNLVLLFHVTEPAGHPYPGKFGLSLSSFTRFAAKHKRLRLVGAHFGGGLPLLLESDARETVAGVAIDTAARSYLYTPEEYRLATLRMPGRVLFGSDYPLIPQKKDIQAIRAYTPDPGVCEAVLGGNAAAFLGLEA